MRDVRTQARRMTPRYSTRGGKLKKLKRVLVEQIVHVLFRCGVRGAHIFCIFCILILLQIWSA